MTFKPGTNFSGYALPPADANTLLRWTFNEPSGTTVNNSGTAGNSAATQLTCLNTYFRGVRQPTGVATQFLGGRAYGAGSYKPSGNISIHAVFTPSWFPELGWILMKSWNTG